jgi:formylglycine-generating enzyme required for sulfatase activity
MKRAFTLPAAVFLCVILLCVSAATRASAEQRTALVIGNNSYSFSPLNNPVHDATDVAAALKKRGFRVTLKTNANLKGMETAIREFGASLKGGGVGLFYYAGHGLQVAGANYLVPVGAKIHSESDVKYETIDAGKILDEMENAGNGLNIVILDACRDNPFSRRFRDMTRGLAVFNSAPAGTYICYSTGPGQVALDGEGRNSPYAAALLQHMMTPGLSIEQVFKRVRQELGKVTDGKQVPWTLSSLQGEFYFTPGEAPQDVPAAPLREEKAEARVPADTAKRKAAVDLPATFTDPLSGIEFILVRGGCFQMGDTFGDGLEREKPGHEVCVNNFYLGKHEVTQEQWKKVMGNNPAHFKSCGENCPVESVSWLDVQTYIAELNGKSEKKFRLPTEAEWEYAARSGGKAEKWSGTSSSGRLKEFALYDDNANDRVDNVGSKKPNTMGFHDMSGSVWEWVQDWYSEDYYKTGLRDNPQGPPEGTGRVVRGGSWLDVAGDIRTSTRFFFEPYRAFRTIGFRLAITVQ